MNRSLGWGIAAALVFTVLVILAVPAMLRAVNEDSPEPGTHPVPVESAVDRTSVLPDSAEGRPDCPGPAVAGVELDCLGHTAEAPAARPTIAVVWAWWCAPCREEMPLFDSFAEQHPEYTVVAVHADATTEAGLDKLNDWGIGLPSYADPHGIFAGTLGLPGVVPVTVVTDADGAVRGTFPRTFTSVEEIRAAVDGALS
ncbi:TlpA family protein disulfide reductase [Corynebacterium sp. CCM 9203]|uniref:TlpA family protein disulfide reductase n=1 Tax=Corynebacterium sp. CCM 9203 TaxID=3057615 RepID=UPI003526A288